MDHWVTQTRQGPQPPSFNRAHMDRYIRQLALLGFTDFDTFFFSIYKYAAMYGSAHKFEQFLQENGFEKIVSVFLAYPYATSFTASHRPETHDRIFADCERTMDSVKELSIENFVVIPTSTCFQVEPVTDEQIKVTADLWNRVGELTHRHGVKVALHFDCLGAVHDRKQIDALVAHSDPALVGVAVNTAELTIAGIDPASLIRDHGNEAPTYQEKVAWLCG